MKGQDLTATDTCQNTVDKSVLLDSTMCDECAANTAVQTNALQVLHCANCSQKKFKDLPIIQVMILQVGFKFRVFQYMTIKYPVHFVCVLHL